MTYLRWLVVFLFPFWIAGLTACSEITGKEKTSPNTGTNKPVGTLYVANGDGSILAFDPPPGANGNLFPVLPQGNLSPTRRFPEGIAGPTGLFLDRTNDTLYAANTIQNALLIYENAGQNPLNPTRVITGSKTGLNHPFAVTYDATRCALYVANKENSVAVFQTDCSQTSQLNGNIAPSRILKGPHTLLDFPRALAVDTQRDILYISNMGSNSILIYQNASLASGDTAPTRTILSHTNTSQTETMLHLPFGLFVDKDNDRLYVVQAGGNQPAIFIYENASQQSGGVIPERVITTPNVQLPLECNVFPPPTGFDSSVCNTAQLIQPAGIDVDVARSQIYVANNSNTNNTNQSGHNNADAAAVVIFKDVLTRCNINAPEPCILSPIRRIGGSATGLANPVGIVVDPDRDFIYLSNPTANNIQLFGLDGNLTPAQVNSGGFTDLEQPNSFFYDDVLDRLYIVNFNSSNAVDFFKRDRHISVYEEVSKRAFFNTPADWYLSGGTTNVNYPRALHIDKTNNRLILLSQNNNRLLIYDFDPTIKPSKGAVVTPNLLISFFPSELTQPRAMTVDEKSGEIYVANATNNRIFTYKINSLITCDPPSFGTPSPPDCPPPDRTITGSNTRLNQPFGLFLDTTKDILYVTNVGAGLNSNSILAFHNASTVNGNVSPSKTISSSQLSTPTAPYLNTATDRLFLINQGTNAIFVYEKASTLDGTREPHRKITGANSCLDFTGGFSGNVDKTGGLWVDTSRGGERLFVGQPTNPTCPAYPQLGFSRGTVLTFGAEGNVTPSRTGSGGNQTGLSAAAFDPTRNTLYVANQGNPAITSDDTLSIFSGIDQAGADLDPPVAVGTGLNNPAGLFVDSGQNRLYLSNTTGGPPLTGTISVTKGSAEVKGTGTLFTSELAPADTIKIGTEAFTISTIASNTLLTLGSPYTGETAAGVVASRNICTCDAILIFDNADGLSSSSVPIVLDSPVLNNPHGLTIDLGRKSLYVANTGGDSVLVFKNVDGLTGPGPVVVAPDAVLSGSLTQIDAPVGVSYDSVNNRLYVLNQGTPAILVFESVSTLNGNVAPARVITVKEMAAPSALFLDTENDRLYVVDQGGNAVYLFEKASQIQGEVEHTTLSGNNTGFTRPSALFIGPTPSTP